MKCFRTVHISSLPPTACGVAEYTAALAESMQLIGSKIAPFFVRLDSETTEVQEGDRRVKINPSDRAAVEMAAAAGTGGVKGTPGARGPPGLSLTVGAAGLTRVTGGSRGGSAPPGRGPGGSSADMLHIVPAR